MGQIANLFGYVLNYIYNFTHNYGLSLILFSVLLRILMLFIDVKQQIAMEKNQEIQAEMETLKVKYKKDPATMNQEIMKLYKDAKINPLSGCLASILTIVIFLSVFWLVSKPLTYMKKVDQNKISSYTEELTKNNERSSYPEILIIDKMGDKDESVKINMDFLGCNLASVPIKVQDHQNIKNYIIPVLYVISSIFLSRYMMNSNMNKKKKEEKDKKVEAKTNGKELTTVDNTQDEMAMMSQSMGKMMPIMSISIALVAPIGLSLYWLVSNLLQLAERAIINYFMEKKKAKEA